MIKSGKSFKEFGLEWVVIILLGLLVLIFIGLLPFIILVFVPVVLMYFILEGLRLDKNVKKLIWIAYFVILFFLVLERIF